MGSESFTEMMLLSVLMAYFWLTVILTFMGAAYLRTRRVAEVELAYATQHPPLPYFTPRNLVETQEVSILPPVDLEPTRRLRHINPSQQVFIEISADDSAEGTLPPTPESNLQKLIYQLTKNKATGTD